MVLILFLDLCYIFILIMDIHLDGMCGKHGVENIVEQSPGTTLSQEK